MIQVSFEAAVAATVVVCFFANRLFRRRRLSSTGKAVLITGCDRGFGFLSAQRLSSLGYRVFAGCFDAAGEGAEKLRLTSPNIDVIQLDVTNDAQVEEARRFIDEQLQGYGLWAIVNNAGTLFGAEVEWCSLSRYQRMMDVNWLGTVRITQVFLPYIRAAKGRVINVASLSGRVAVPGYALYSSTKFAVVGFTDSLRREMFKFDVKVITIEPSGYRTVLIDPDSLKRQGKQIWEETPAEVRRDFGEKYFQGFQGRISQLLRFSSPKIYQVVDDIMHAVTSAHPYKRYVAMLVNQLPVDFFCILPNLLQDWILDLIFKVHVKLGATSDCSQNGKTE